MGGFTSYSPNNNNSKKIYVAYALCEGQIGGLYDIYFDDTSSICLDKNDSDTRSSQTAENTIDVLCQGRMDRGDTLSGFTTSTGAQTRRPGYSRGYGVSEWAINAEIAASIANIDVNPASFGSGASTSAAGIGHERGTNFSTPIDTRLIFHAGKPNQKANSLLVNNANRLVLKNSAKSANSANETGPKANFRTLFSSNLTIFFV